MNFKDLTLHPLVTRIDKQRNQSNALTKYVKVVSNYAKCAINAHMLNMILQAHSEDSSFDQRFKSIR